MANNIINQLDQDTINLIAAGEVIERPMSVVKELLENAIDAGASAITVEIKEGGISYIRITDNGCGIAKSEIHKAFLRHATSKIANSDDLSRIHSLGFRGEALSSIAAVAQVEMITKTPDQTIGCCYTIEGGEEKGLEEIGAPDGTTFIVRNIFYHTPVRKKFLKSVQTEAGYISELVEKVALSHPETAIKLIVNGQNKIVTNGNSNLKDMIYSIYGRDVAANLIEIHEKNEFFSIDGYIGKPIIARGNRSMENYFVNGRYVKSKVIAKGIEDGYKSFLMQHRYPFCTLHLTIPSDELDVNVHPTKMELRINREADLYRSIYYIVQNALSGKEYIPEVVLMEQDSYHPDGHSKSTGRDNTAPEPFEKKRLSNQNDTVGLLKEMGTYGKHHAAASKKSEYESIKSTHYSHENSSSNQVVSNTQQIEANDTPIVVPATAYEPATASESSAASYEPSATCESSTASESSVACKSSAAACEPNTNKTKNDYTQPSLVDSKVISEKNRDQYRLIGQVFKTYWLFEFQDNMYVMDQHAAHEKVLFEKNMQMFRSHTSPQSQLLSPPVVFTITDKQLVYYDKIKGQLAAMGYEIEEFGGNEYAIRAIPINIPNVDPVSLMIEILDDAVADDIVKLSDYETLYDRVATMSCKAAVKGNNTLSFTEANALLDELMTLDNPYMCPHGRPTIVTISKKDMEKYFKRIL